MEKVYTIVLSDGTEISNLTKNGTNYVSEAPLRKDIFVNNCSPMTIQDGDKSELHENAELLQVMEFKGKYYLAFRDIPKKELEEARIRSDIDYIAMMSEIDLEEV